MSSRSFPAIPRPRGPVLLIGSVLLAGVLLVTWKRSNTAFAANAGAGAPEPAELVTVARAEPRSHRLTTTAVGTVRALQSITLRNELAGTVRKVSLVPGRIVEAGALLVALDVDVELADLRAAEAEAALAGTTLERMERLRQHQATSQEEVDQARAQRDMAQARVAHIRAVIGRKTIRAPFRARVGIADVHPGQYLNEGTVLTTLQGVSREVDVDFEVAQQVAALLKVGGQIEVGAGDSGTPLTARITAVDSRVDSTTRNATVRARLAAADNPPSPGASVRVQVPVGESVTAVAIPVSALRRGPAGDHVWLIQADSTGVSRAHEQAVRTGPVLGDTVLILAGLKAGDQVAAAGSFKLREALKVDTAAAAPAAAPQGE